VLLLIQWMVCLRVPRAGVPVSLCVCVCVCVYVYACMCMCVCQVALVSPCCTLDMAQRPCHWTTCSAKPRHNPCFTTSPCQTQWWNADAGSHAVVALSCGGWISTLGLASGKR